MREVDEKHPDHRRWLPHRNYRSVDVKPVKTGEKYIFDVEIWPTNVVIKANERLVLEVASHDTQGSGYFTHNHPEDRPEARLKGCNNIEFGPDAENYLTLPIIPTR
jgi:hypothetical protein